ncbi:MAG: DnaJ C-terminal domain-containing protein [Phycisphaerae bacterium]
MSKRDYYEILGVSRSAGEKDIKSAYRKLARKFHPDVNKEPDAQEKFQEATEAYEVLTDPEKRKLYDQFGHAGMQGGFAGAGGPGGGPRPGGGGGVNINFEDIFGGGGGGRSGFMNMGLDEILEALGGFGGRKRRGGRTRRQPVRGQDLEYHIELDFLQACRGATVALKLKRREDTETIDVKIPAGVKDGSKVRIRGKGGQGPAGAGDLYIHTRVKPHPYFRRDGDNIYVDVPISITEAAMGGQADVPTLDGVSTVRIPAGSSSGRQLRLRGKGVAPRGRPAGDLLAVLKIVPPPSLSDEGEQLLKKFDQTEDFNPRANAPWKS